MNSGLQKKIELILNRVEWMDGVRRISQQEAEWQLLDLIKQDKINELRLVLIKYEEALLRYTDNYEDDDLYIYLVNRIKELEQAKGDK